MKTEDTAHQTCRQEKLWGKHMCFIIEFSTQWPQGIEQWIQSYNKIEKESMYKPTCEYKKNVF